MKRFLILICLVGALGSTTAGQDKNGQDKAGGLIRKLTDQCAQSNRRARKLQAGETTSDYFHSSHSVGIIPPELSTERPSRKFPIFSSGRDYLPRSWRGGTTAGTHEARLR